MNYQDLRLELRDYYENRVNEMAREFCESCTAELDRLFDSSMSAYEMKALQYTTIAARCRPVLFAHSPFYYETGTLSAHCDGARDFRGHSHAGGWTYHKNQHLFLDQNPELYALKRKQAKALFYLICGKYNDDSQHFGFHYRPVFAGGLRSLYEQAKANLEKAETREQTLFLQSVCAGMLALKQMSEKFAALATERAKKAHGEEKADLERIALSAARCPWEAPQSFYEALNTYAFLRKAVGALEGVGLNSFGRPDVALYPFYQKDLASGNLTQGEAYDLICKFLLTWDMHYDHDMKMVGYADHELENTYVLGGCGKKGDPVCNELTMMFLRATREEKIIYPKIKCRFSKNSPKKYLDEIDRAVLGGTTAVLYQNDDATIPALIRAGRTVEEARDYLISGCWDLNCQGVEKSDCGAYVNLLKPFEYSIHRMENEMEEVGMHFAPVDGAKSFEEVYAITRENIHVLLLERARISRLGGGVWNQVDPLPIYSSAMDTCLDTMTDFTAGGGKYRDDRYLCFGLPNIVDSLLAIRQLCFEEKKYTLSQFLEAVRTNWEGNEIMRLDAVHCNGWGDGSDASCQLASRLQNDLFEMAGELTGTYGGKVLIGHLTYTEIRFWGEQTKATPDGRRDGEYFSQGLTPSRLKKIPAVTSVINSLCALDPSTIGGNSVVNIILPAGKITPEICEAFLRASAESAMQSLQLNCVSREELLDAQKHPENHRDLIVRVTGFSARFTSLSPQWQDEFLSRNFYE